jgi:hypothetical protein
MLSQLSSQLASALVVEGIKNGDRIPSAGILPSQALDSSNTIASSGVGDGAASGSTADLSVALTNRPGNDSISASGAGSMTSRYESPEKGKLPDAVLSNLPSTTNSTVAAGNAEGEKESADTQSQSQSQSQSKQSSGSFARGSDSNGGSLSSRFTRRRRDRERDKSNGDTGAASASGARGRERTVRHKRRHL